LYKIGAISGNPDDQVRYRPGFSCAPLSEFHSRQVLTECDGFSDQGKSGERNKPADAGFHPENTAVQPHIQGLAMVKPDRINLSDRSNHRRRTLTSLPMVGEIGPKEVLRPFAPTACRCKRSIGNV
jgi:hypothetical protein